MIKIIDATLTMLDEFEITKKQVETIVFLLRELSITSIVISPGIYELLDGIIPEKIECYLECPVSYHLREDKYSGIYAFISTGGNGEGRNIRNVQINDLSELSHLPSEYLEKKLRITGLDDLLIYESNEIYQRGMQILKLYNPILYPENSYFCATATAVDYLQFNTKGTVMSTLLGIGNKAATEQVLLAMRVIERYKPNLCFEKIVCLRNLIEEITKCQISEYAPVMGRKIFSIESGVHVAGVLKKPSNYETYPPELVGAHREIVLGKHSGTTSVRYKLEQLGIAKNLDAVRITEKVKRISIKKSGAVTDRELRKIVEEELADAKTGENC